MSLGNGLVGTGFTSRYQLQPSSGHYTLFSLSNLQQGYYYLLTFCPRQTAQLITGVCAHDKSVLQQFALNVHITT